MGFQRRVRCVAKIDKGDGGSSVVLARLSGAGVLLLAPSRSVEIGEMQELGLMNLLESIVIPMR